VSWQWHPQLRPRNDVNYPAGTYDIAVQYFDLRTGVSRYSLQLNGKQIAAWSSSDTLPPAVIRPQLDGQTSTRYTVRGIELHPRDRLELIGVPDRSVGETHQRRPGRPFPERIVKYRPAGIQTSGNRRPVDYVEIGQTAP
jgi:alpha-glucuronidase